MPSLPRVTHCCSFCFTLSKFSCLPFLSKLFLFIVEMFITIFVKAVTPFFSSSRRLLSPEIASSVPRFPLRDVQLFVFSHLKAKLPARQQVSQVEKAVLFVTPASSPLRCSCVPQCHSLLCCKAIDRFCNLRTRTTNFLVTHKHSLKWRLDQAYLGVNKSLMRVVRER